jgi:hypothetical protein
MITRRSKFEMLLEGYPGEGVPEYEVDTQDVTDFEGETQHLGT